MHNKTQTKQQIDN